MSAQELLALMHEIESHARTVQKQAEEAGIMASFFHYLLTEGVLTAGSLHEVKSAWSAFNNRLN